MKMFIAYFKHRVLRDCSIAVAVLANTREEAATLAKLPAYHNNAADYSLAMIY